MRECKAPRCRNLTNKTYCEAHRKESYSFYNSKRKDDDAMKFYKSREWREKRLEILKRDCFTCQHCGETANLVHHLVEVRVDFSKRLDNGNLESVCKSCHNKIDHKKS